MNPSILTQLRIETAAAHEHLEALARMKERVADPRQYAGLIEKFLGFYEPLESRLTTLEGWAARGLDLAARRKTPSLECDLAALGRSAEEVAALPRCARLPAVGNLTRGFGCAYVLEAATLGGRHISGLLRGSAIPAEARTFFGSYGEEVGARWREFVAALEAFAAAGQGGGEIVAAACETFECMGAWLGEERAA